MSDRRAWAGSGCAVVEELLGGFDAGDLNEAAHEVVRQHIDSCASCTAKLAELSASAEMEPAPWPPAGAEVGAGAGAAVGVGAAQPGPLGVLTETPGGGRDRRWLLSATAILLAGTVISAGVAGAWFLTARSPAPAVIAPAAGPASDIIAMAGGPAGPASNVIASLTAVGDDEVLAHGFALERPLDLRVYAVGEGSSDGMYDYGWIVDASTRQPAWTMHYGDTQHAGGADKNRVVDQVISLGAGNYIVYYVTDGSHSYESWNSARPSDPEDWGVTVMTSSARDRRAVGPYDPKADRAILAQLIGAGDREHRRHEFTLDREAEIHVYVIGEGMDNEMYDYAWIENARTRRTVWEMTYGQTRHAGGADKNRVVNGKLKLPAGSYVVHYQTDDSHSFNDWNSSPPADLFNYGVTLTRADR
jgi:hypothetical protein